MTRYLFGVQWIALNDNAGNGDSQSDIAGYISTCLLADLYRKDPSVVAAQVLKMRQELFASEAQP